MNASSFISNKVILHILVSINRTQHLTKLILKSVTIDPSDFLLQTLCMFKHFCYVCSIRAGKRNVQPPEKSQRTGS